MDIVSGILEVFKFFGLSNPALAGGWIVAAFSTAFMIWRIKECDRRIDEFNKKYEELLDKVTKIIVIQEEEWRKLVSKTDEITYDMLETSTQTMTVLTEKINTLQMFLLQMNGKK